MKTSRCGSRAGWSARHFLACWAKDARQAGADEAPVTALIVWIHRKMPTYSIQEPLADAPEIRPQEFPQPRPQILQRVVVDLADLVAVVVPRPLPCMVQLAKRPSRAPAPLPTPRRTRPTRPPYTITHPWRRRPPHGPLQRFAVHIIQDEQVHLPGLALPDHSRHRRPVARRERAVCSASRWFFPAAAAGPRGQRAAGLFSPAFWNISLTSTIVVRQGEAGEAHPGAVLQAVAQLEQVAATAAQLAGQPGRGEVPWAMPRTISTTWAAVRWVPLSRVPVQA